MRVTGATFFCSIFFVSFTAESIKADNAPDQTFLVCVSNEKSGDVSIIDGANNKLISNIPVGKRPRGIHASPDRGLLFVALSGSTSVGPRFGVSAMKEGPEEDPA